MAHPSDAFTTIVHPDVKAWIDGLPAPDDPLLAQMEAYCAERRFPLIGRTSGRVLELLTRLIGGRRVFEFGSGFGFSAFWFARAVGEGGEVIGSEKDAHEIAAHERFYAGHPLKARIRIHQGSAYDVFASTTGTFDAVLIDIHKQGYVEAYEMAVPRIRSGGLLLADNTLWGGKAARPVPPGDADTAAIVAFDRKISADPRLDTVILPVGDGLSVSRVR